MPSINGLRALSGISATSCVVTTPPRLAVCVSSKSRFGGDFHGVGDGADFEIDVDTRDLGGSQCHVVAHELLEALHRSPSSYKSPGRSSGMAYAPPLSLHGSGRLVRRNVDDLNFGVGNSRSTRVKNVTGDGGAKLLSAQRGAQEHKQRQHGQFYFQENPPKRWTPALPLFCAASAYFTGSLGATISANVATTQP